MMASVQGNMLVSIIFHLFCFTHTWVNNFHYCFFENVPQAAHKMDMTTDTGKFSIDMFFR